MKKKNILFCFNSLKNQKLKKELKRSFKLRGGPRTGFPCKFYPTNLKQNKKGRRKKTQQQQQQPEKYVWNRYKVAFHATATHMYIQIRWVAASVFWCISPLYRLLLFYTFLIGKAAWIAAAATVASQPPCGPDLFRRNKQKRERKNRETSWGFSVLLFWFFFLFLSYLILSQEEEEGALARICVLIYYYSLVISLRRDL